MLRFIGEEQPVTANGCGNMPNADFFRQLGESIDARLRETEAANERRRAYISNACALNRGMRITV